MSLFNRRFVLLSGLALAGCGFEPVYGTGGVASDLRGSILVDEPTTRNEFRLVEHLEQRLGRASSPQYGLKVVLSVSEEGLAVTGSNNITRFNVLGVADFALRDLASGDVVYSSKVNTFTSYSASSQPVSTSTAERDAQDRLMVALGDKITAKLLANAGSF